MILGRVSVGRINPSVLELLLMEVATILRFRSRSISRVNGLRLKYISYPMNCTMIGTVAMTAGAYMREKSIEFRH